MHDVPVRGVCGDENRKETTLSESFQQWCVVEIMGHQTYCGLVTEQTIGGQAFVRVDVPEQPGEGGEPATPAFSKLFGSSAIYCITPVAEDVCRAALRRNRSRPLNVYLPELYPPKETRRLMAPLGGGYADPMADDLPLDDEDERE